jgi:tetratricopeptide (TPR) repeat protein
MNVSQIGRWDRWLASLLVLGCGLLAPAALGQAKGPEANGSVLQQRYDAAQRYQAAQDLDHAAQQYRMFLSEALGEIAVGRAHVGEYDKAADDFDEALRLVPDSPEMQIRYAQAALESGKLDHAKLLAMGVIRNNPNDSKDGADAHGILGRVLLKTGKIAEARQELEEAVALDSTFENGYQLAVADLDGGDEKGATKIFAEMQASFGDTAVLHLQFGRAYLNSDFQSDAVEEFQKAIAEDDRLPGVHYSLAAAYLSTAGHTKLPEAEAELNKEIAIFPDEAAAYAALGHLLAAQHHGAEEDAEAEKDLKRATELDPKNPDGFFYLGQFYADLKKLPEAEAALRQSIAMTTDVSRNAYQVQKARYLLGRLLMQTGQADEGNQQIAAAHALTQQNLARDQNRLSDYLQEKRDTQTSGMGDEMPRMEDKPADAEAVQQVDALEKQLGPVMADSYNNLGAIAGSEGNATAALRYFEEAEEWNPALPGLDYNLGRAAFAAGAFAQAVGPVSRYLRAHPEEEGARAVLGLSQFNTKDYAGARKTLEPLDGNSGEAPQLQFAYAESLIQTGDASGGVERLLVLEKADPHVAEVHRALGEAYVTTKAAGAAEELETAIRLNPVDAEAHGALGRLELAQGDAKQAVTHLEAAAKLEPGNAALQQELADASRKAAQH